MKYFAYGEKMCTAQLYNIVPNALCLGVVKAMGYKLFFHNKGSHDPSGKCNIMPVQDPACEIFGVLYEISPSDRYLLDKDQCLGYQNQEITLKVFPNLEDQLMTPMKGVFAFTYIADKDNIFEDLVPYHWYKELIISGAKEHQLPAEYIHHLEQFSSTQDPNVQRANKQKRYLESLLL
ncbi:MAG: gamma-glutamylcyclotransferase [Proteobacteria bacterium]|nr:gamma-glutamylcyclotransferase [Pseudomonadota bacterium]